MVACVPVGLRSIIQPQEHLHLLIWPTKDHVEGEKVAVFEVAVSGEGIDGEGLEGVVEEEAVLDGGIKNGCPAGGDEVLLDLAGRGGLAVILGLADGEGDLTIRPLHDGGEFHVISKDFVCGDPALQILQRCGVDELDGLTRAGLATQVRHRVGDNLRDEAELWRDGEFTDASQIIRQLDDVLRADMTIWLRVTKFFPCCVRVNQEAKFISESKRLFGFVFCAAGPVVPSTFEVVATKVA